MLVKWFEWRRGGGGGRLRDNERESGAGRARVAECRAPPARRAVPRAGGRCAGRLPQRHDRLDVDRRRRHAGVGDRCRLARAAFPAQRLLPPQLAPGQ